MYDQHFGLRARPFQLNPDPDFFFGSSGHKRATAYLEYGLHQGEGFIVITGEVGAGKTTLVRSLLGRLDADTIVPVQIVSTQVDADDLLRLVATAFGLGHHGPEKSTLLTALQTRLEGLHAQGRRALLIVDEAQNLTPRAVEELRMLSNFQVDSTALLQSFLIGQPEFRGILQRPEMRQLRQRVIASCHLGPLDASETRGYVEHRLRHVGWQDDPRFDPDAFDAIHAATDGIPRRINLVCDRLLLAAYLAERHEIGAESVREVAAELEDELSGARGTPIGTTDEASEPASSGATSATTSTRPLVEKMAMLENRISTLETTNGATQTLIRRLMSALRQARPTRVAAQS